MRTIRLTIAFDGTNYKGWQLQPNAPTIQGAIEGHLRTIHNKHVTLHGAGRTDAGVHSLGMVAHFATEKSIPCEVFLQSLNSMLHNDIRILEAKEVPSSFHSRFSAKGKNYLYSIFNGEIMLPQSRLFSFHIRKKLNFPLMQTCLNHLIGTHDFASFETAGSRDPNFPSKKGSTRTITQAKIISESNDFYIFNIIGDGFLRHMVRNIVGTTLEVGLGRRNEEGFLSALHSKSRSQGGATAPARGLTLKEIYY